MSAPEPHAPDIRRLLVLRQVPGLAEAELAELATLAENLVETTFPAGAIIATPTARLTAIHLVVEGLLEVEQPRWRWEAREVFGAFEVMAGRPVSAVVTARRPTTTLQLAAADFAELLEDNYSILTTARRALAHRLLALHRARPGTDGAIVSSERVEIDAPAPARALDMVDRLWTLRQLGPFTSARLEALAALAQAAEEVVWSAGTRPCHPGSPADAIDIIVSGALQATRRDGVRELVIRNDAIGVLETLGERPHDRLVEALTSVRVLRIPGAALLDVLEDHTDFALGLISRLAAEVLDLTSYADGPPIGN